jgi:hypothetical protein
MVAPANVGLFVVLRRWFSRGWYDPAAWNVDCAMVEPFPRTRFVPESEDRDPDDATTVPASVPMFAVEALTFPLSVMVPPVYAGE